MAIAHGASINDASFLKQDKPQDYMTLESILEYINITEPISGQILLFPNSISNEKYKTWVSKEY